MELSTKDYNRLVSALEKSYDTLDWQTGTNPTVDAVHREIGQCLRILKSYIDTDSIETIAEQLELNFDTEDDQGYQVEDE